MDGKAIDYRPTLRITICPLGPTLPSDHNYPTYAADEADGCDPRREQGEGVHNMEYCYRSDSYPRSSSITRSSRQLSVLASTIQVL